MGLMTQEWHGTKSAKRRYVLHTACEYAMDMYIGALCMENVEM
jgi:hypothetical protein